MSRSGMLLLLYQRRFKVYTTTLLPTFETGCVVQSHNIHGMDIFADQLATDRIVDQQQAIFTDIRPPWERGVVTNLRSLFGGQSPPLELSSARCDALGRTPYSSNALS